jgi:flagellar motor switch protein FliN
MNDMTGGFPVDASVAANFRLLQDVDVKLTVEIGSTTLSLRELLALGETSVIELDREANELLDVFVNGTLIGRGEVVTVGEKFGVRMTELVSPEKRAAAHDVGLYPEAGHPAPARLRAADRLPLCLAQARGAAAQEPGREDGPGQGDDDARARPAPRGGRVRGAEAARLGEPHRRHWSTRPADAARRLPCRARWAGARRCSSGCSPSFILFAAPAFAQAVPRAGSQSRATPGVGDAVDRALGDLGGGNAPLSLSLQVLIIMGLLTVLPGILLMMTSFTRIIIVLSMLRQALGLQQTPPNQVLIGLSLFLSFFVMAPVINQMNTNAIQPYAAGRSARRR